MKTQAVSKRFSASLCVLRGSAVNAMRHSRTPCLLIKREKGATRRLLLLRDVATGAQRHASMVFHDFQRLSVSRCVPLCSPCFCGEQDSESAPAVHRTKRKARDEMSAHSKSSHPARRVELSARYASAVSISSSDGNRLNVVRYNALINS